MKVTIKNLYFSTILLFPIAVLFQTYLGAINKVLFAALLALQVYLWLKRFDLKSGFFMMLAIINEMVAVLLTNGSANNTNEYFYFPFCVIYTLYMVKSMDSYGEYIKTHKRFVLNIMRIWTVLVVFSLFLPSSYNTVWGENGRYFGSLCRSIFRFAPSCIFIMTLSLSAIVIYHERKYIVYCILPLVSIYMGGSRTYLLVALVLYVIIWYYFARRKKTFFLSFIPMLAVLVYAIFHSSIGDKIMATTYTDDSYFDFWGTITSGRSIFWAADIKHFKESSWLIKLIGNGLNMIYEINYEAFGGYVWAHNDFIQCLISHGLIGLALYLLVLRKLFVMAKKKHHTEWIPYLCAIFVWLGNAMFNMFYTYFCAMLCLPFIIYNIRIGKRQFEFKEPKVQNQRKINEM